MVIGNNTGFRCPQCGAAAAWTVDHCDACGYRTGASRVWEAEERKAKREDQAQGCLGAFVDVLWINGTVELAALLGRGVIALLRAVVSVLT
jgi:hypothetical protein